MVRSAQTQDLRFSPEIRESAAFKALRPLQILDRDDDAVLTLSRKHYRHALGRGEGSGPFEASSESVIKYNICTVVRIC